MWSLKRIGFLITLLMPCAVPTLSQQPGGGPVREGTAPPNPKRLPKYVLGPGDQIMIFALDADEIANKPIPIPTEGDINLLLVGRIHVAGMTIDQLEAELTKRLRVFIQNPEVAVTVTQFRSQPVSVIGFVGSPGVLQLEGRKNLIEVLSQAGGARPDAGYRVQITRKSEWGPIPLPTARTDSNGFSIAEVNIRDIMNAVHPEENIQILPEDVISVPKAEVVYVMGEVRKPGGFALNDKQRISVLQALALAEGIQPTASKKNGRIVRPVPGANREEIAINLDDLLNGKAKDMLLEPDDILLVPNSATKSAMKRTIESAINTTFGMIIYRGAW